MLGKFFDILPIRAVADFVLREFVFSEAQQYIHIHAYRNIQYIYVMKRLLKK